MDKPPYSRTLIFILWVILFLLCISDKMSLLYINIEDIIKIGITFK